MGVKRLEHEQKIQIRNGKDYIRAKARDGQAYTGKDVKQIRQSKGWSQTHLARYIDVDRSFICNIEAGRKPLSPRVIDFISQNKEILST
jgi:DNA-binding transcriptional regulator YiaG